MLNNLHKLTKNTQFIVITHTERARWKQRMFCNGITMQEKGVSTLVSVKLIEEQVRQLKVRRQQWKKKLDFSND